MDSEINDQYRTLSGSLRFLNNIVRFPGCGTFDPEGSFVAVTWGGTLPGGATDVFAAVSRDGGRTCSPPVRVSQDKWMLDGCPDDGP